MNDSGEESLKNVESVRKVYVPLLLICCPNIMTNQQCNCKNETLTLKPRDTSQIKQINDFLKQVKQFAGKGEKTDTDNHHQVLGKSLKEFSSVI